VRRGARTTALALTAAAALVAAGCAGSPSPVRRSGPATTAPAATSSTTTTSTLPSAVPTTVPTPVVPAAGWSHPATALPPAGGFTSVSCISDVFCLAAGGGSNEADAAGSTGPGTVTAWDGATWGTSATYFAGAAGSAPPPWLPAIDCTDGPMCAVVDGSGHTSLGNGTTWSAPAPLAPVVVPAPDPSDPGPGHTGARTAAVSCPSSQFCAYVDNTGHAATFQGTTWTAPQVFTTRVGPATVDLFQSGRVGVSCPTAASCTALIGDTELDWDGTAWTSAAGPWGAAGPGDTAVSCPVPGTCTAVHGTSVSTKAPGSGWSPPRVIYAGGGLDAVSCPTAEVCVAADASGNVLRESDGVWGAPQKVVPTPSAYTGDGTGLSCPTEQFCMMLTGDGDYATYQGTDPGPGP
jgi:hypothetical protein